MPAARTTWPVSRIRCMAAESPDMHYLFAPGLWSSSPVRVAVLVGTVVAITSAVVGVFTVIRGQSFAGHSLADVATTGGSGAFLAGISQFWGFLIAGIAGAAIIE